MGLSWLALLTPVWYTGTVREEDGMEKCVKCGVFMEKMEVFPKVREVRCLHGKDGSLSKRRLLEMLCG